MNCNSFFPLLCLVTNMTQIKHVVVKERISQSNAEFASALYTEVANKSNGTNIVISPLGIHTILALMYTGAVGETAEELVLGLHLPNHTEQVQLGFQAIVHDLVQDHDNVTLKMAKKIYVSREFHVKDTFKNNAKKFFKTAIQTMDFSSPYAKAVINQWVAQKTKTIRNMITDDSFSDKTKMLLVNAVYFKGLWIHEFPKTETESQTFHETKTKQYEVKMMHTKDYFKYVELKELGAKVLALPYQGGHHSLVIVLPFEIEGLPLVEENLRSMKTNKLIKNVKEIKVSVTLPKFKLALPTELDSILPKLGIKKIFSNTSQFLNISAEPLEVSRVFHKAFIDVNEEGTEAAAVTYLGFVQESAEEMEFFYADHPFLFLLQCSKSDTILFMGRVYTPESD